MFVEVTHFIEQGGYLGILVGMFLESVFPPIPSELVMLFAGASAARGEMFLTLAVLAGAIGSTLGLLPWYMAAEWYGKNRLKQFADAHGRLLTFAGSDIEKADQWFAMHSKKAVFVARALPLLRTLIAIPAAILRMNLWMFLLTAFLGSLAWDGLFGIAGFVLGENTGPLTTYLDMGTYGVFALIICWYLYRVITFTHRKDAKST